MFGSHLSIAGGMERALLEAKSLGLDTVQVFTRNQQQWRIPPLEPTNVQLFRHHAAQLHFEKLVAHDSYLINMATGDRALRQKSLDAITSELDRCDALGIFALVTHGGSHGGDGESVGLARLIKSINAVLDRTSARTLMCLETTAGQGASLNYRFEHIRDVMAGVRNASRVAVCLDTAHVFAAGYDLRTAESTAAVLEEFNRVIGFDHLATLHLNDSLKPLGSRVDRHAHIGHGTIGLEAFATIVQHSQFLSIPKILETPKGEAPDGRPWDTVNLQILRLLMAGHKPTSRSVQKALADNPVDKPRSAGDSKRAAAKGEIAAEA